MLQELKESFNYGLFCPPVNGKAGKFLDEERRLGDYPFSGPVGYLEVSRSLGWFVREEVHMGKATFIPHLLDSQLSSSGLTGVYLDLMKIKN